MVRIKDVAQFANVSSATVSRVLSNKGQIRDSTREKVLEAINTLGYKPSRVARSLRVRSSQIIGLIISDIQNPFFTSLVRAVEDVAHQNGYAIFLCNSDEHIEKEALYIDLMIAEQVAGVIITTTQEAGSPCKKLLEANIPLVSIDRRVFDCEVDTVVLDNVRGAYEVVNHLIGFGHERIGVIIGSQTMTTGRERYEGYLSALTEHGIQPEPALIRFGPPTSKTGYEMANALLSLDPPPTAIFTGNNLITIGALHAIQEKNLAIPDDISLVAFDDPEWASIIQPRLTVVAQPTYELGQIAATLVLKRIKDAGDPCETVVLPPEVRIRESVKRVTIS